jgi:hypothetical protein
MSALALVAACGVPKIGSHLQIRIFRESAPNAGTPQACARIVSR